jgi:glycosyltransferase involved in cell wall biosynthesis
MNILFVLHDDYEYGSAKSFLNILMMFKDNHNLFVINNRSNEINRICDLYKIPNISLNYDFIVVKRARNFIYTKVKAFLNRLNNQLRNFFLLSKVTRFLGDKIIDIVHTNTSVVGFGYFLSTKLNVPHYWHLREYGDKDFDFYHSFNFKNFKNFENNYFIGVSESISAEWKNKGININKIKTIYNGFNFSTVSPSFNGVKTVDKRFLFLGALSQKKGHLTLIDTLLTMDKDTLNNIVIDIIGSGEDSFILTLKNLIQKHNLENNINLLGYIDKSKIDFSIYSFGLNISASEAFGRVNVEYIQNGLLPLLPNNSAGGEIVDFDYPLFFDSSSKSSLSNAISISLKLDNSHDLFNKVYESASKKFDNAHMIKDLLNYYGKSQKAE